MIIANFPDSAEVKKIEIAGPGFINFFMSQGSNALVLANSAKSILISPKILSIAKSKCQATHKSG
jgi:arginyl-tRNA synthetase